MSAPRFTISGPGIDAVRPFEAGAVSLAVNAAGGVGRPKAERDALGELSVYVRNPAGEVVARVDRDTDGCLSLFRVQS